MLIEAAAEQGDACAKAYCIYTGWGGRDNDEEEAFKRFLELSEKEGHDAAMNMTGYFYNNNIGVAMDKERAVEWYTKAAEKGCSEARFNLGVCYAQGKGVTMDKEKAVGWYTMAAEKGCSDAKFNLGVCYEHGRGVAMDKEKAVEWYKKAAEQGHSVARNFSHLWSYRYEEI